VQSLTVDNSTTELARVTISNVLVHETDSEGVVRDTHIITSNPNLTVICLMLE
jgi:hypothetical protein